MAHDPWAWLPGDPILSTVLFLGTYLATNLTLCGVMTTNSAEPLMSLRRSTLSRIFAVWFVVLIVLPFTAPFQVWSDGPAFSKAQGDDLKSSDKLSKDAATVGVFSSGLTGSNSIVFWHRPLYIRTLRYTLTTVLRL